MHLEMDSLRKGYAELGAQIMRFGHETSPRGERTVEVLGASITVWNPEDILPMGTGRGVVKALAATEALQLIGGLHDPEVLVRAAPHFAAYLDPKTGLQRAAYGPRLIDQIPVAIDHLTRDPDSRKAQVTVWHPGLDTGVDLPDHPCTTSLQWLLRNDLLHMQVHMRSNDFWLGLPYDAFQFAQLQLAIAKVLGVGLGAYRHSAASLHVYEKHFEKVDALHEPTSDAPPTFGIVGQNWQDAVRRARGLHDGNVSHISELSPGEQWFHLAMAPTHG